MSVKVNPESAQELYYAIVEDLIPALQVFHGKPGWDIYWNKSPEMLRVRRILEKATTEVLCG
jgi:hypothetical protein